MIGVPDERLGQVGKAFVVWQGTTTAEDLIAWSRSRMARYRYIEFLDGLPLNATGKVMNDLLC